MELGKAYVTIGSDMQKFSREVEQARDKTKRATEQMQKNFDKVKRSVDQLSSAARWGFLAYAAALGVGVYAAQQQEKATAKLVQQLKNHNEATKENIDALLDQASALQRVTQFGDEQITAGQAMLASFSLTTKQIKELTPHLLNLAIMTENTSGAQADLASVAKMVGVALGGQAGRLVQMGIKLTDTQRKMLELADENEKINILMEIFEENAGSLAIATGKTLAGALSKAKNAMGDLAEEIGFLLKPVIVQTTQRIVDITTEWGNALKALTPKQKEAIVKVTLMTGAILALVGSLSLFGKIAGLFIAIGTLIMGVLGLILTPIGLITVGIVALALAWANNWGDIQGKTEAVWNAIEPIFNSINGWMAKYGKVAWEWTINLVGKAWDWLREQAFPKISDVLSKTWTWTIATAGKAWEWLKEDAFPKITSTLDKVWIWTINTAGKAWEWLKEGVFPEIINILDKTWKWTLELSGNAWDWLKNVWPNISISVKGFWEWLSKLSNVAFTFSIDLAGAIWNFLQFIWPEIKEPAKAFWKWLEPLRGKTINWVVNIAGKTWDWLKSVWPIIKDYAIGLWDWLKSLANKTYEWSIDIIGKAWDWLENKWPAIKDSLIAFKDWLIGLPADIKKVYELVIKIVKPEESAEDTAKTWWDTFREQVIKIGKTVQLKLEVMWDFVTLIGSFFQGFIRGMSKKFKEDDTAGKIIVDAIKAYLEAEFRAWEWLKQIVEEHIEDWRKIGEIIGEKIGEGIRWWFEHTSPVYLFGKIGRWIGDLFKKEEVKLPTPGWEMSPDAIENLNLIREEMGFLSSEIIKASKAWDTYSQEMKIITGKILAYQIWANNEQMKMAYEMPEDFARAFNKGFMSASPDIQKAIIQAFQNADIKKAMALAGFDLGKLLMVKQSPTGIEGGIIEGQKQVTKTLEDNLTGMIDKMGGFAEKIAGMMEALYIKIIEPVVESVITAIEKIDPALAETLRGMLQSAKDFIGEWKGMWEDAGGSIIGEWAEGATAMFEIIPTVWQEALSEIVAGFQTTKDFAKAFFQDVISGWSSTISQFIKGAITFQDFMINMFQNVLDAFYDMVAQMAANWLFKTIFGGIFGGILPFEQGGIIPGGVEGFQSGGIIRQPTLALMGEGGKDEAVIPLQGGAVPVRLTGAMPGNLTVHMNFPNARDRVEIEYFARRGLAKILKELKRDGVLPGIGEVRV